MTVEQLPSDADSLKFWLGFFDLAKWIGLGFFGFLLGLTFIEQFLERHDEHLEILESEHRAQTIAIRNKFADCNRCAHHPNCIHSGKNIIDLDPNEVADIEIKERARKRKEKAAEAKRKFGYQASSHEYEYDNSS